MGSVDVALGWWPALGPALMSCGGLLFHDVHAAQLDLGATH